MAPVKPSFAVVTVSYAPDFERCKLLAESTEKCLSDNTKHYIIVDRKDLFLFNSLQSLKVKILTVEDILPWWIFRIPLFSKGWISLRTLPIRNWVLQQLVKLSAVNVIDEDILVFCDSDVTFIRPFDVASVLLKEECLALLRVDFQSQDILKWANAAKQLLGIPDKNVPVVNYVGNLIAWRRENILKLHSRLEEVNRTHWIQAVCKHWNISEYMIYGMMVEHVLGIENAGHFIATPELIKSAWAFPLDNQKNIDNFFGTVQESHIGVMIHSKYKVPVESYRYKFDLLWQQNC